MSEHILTIAIPTYNRSAVVQRSIENILQRMPSDKVCVLVSDNGSGDGTEEVLQKFSSRENFSYSRNKENLGYRFNALKLVELVKTPYFMLLSDEDDIISDINPVINFITQEKKAFFSPIHVRGNTVYRGRAHKANIDLMEVDDSAFYISGLIYDSVQAKRNLDVYLDIATSYPDASLYIQYVLASVAICQGGGMWLPYPLTTFREERETVLTAETREPYHSVSSRWRQVRQFLEIFNVLEARIPEVTAEHSLRMRQGKYKKIIHLLSLAIQQEIPEGFNDFEQSVMEHGVRLYMAKKAQSGAA